ncbi:MAG TPA: hypothetical protein VJG90_01120 [Candidatus Nanoarchaeia archaeon]|nr:hypothetical protein [Candidatus Nanoarchaeia archaeon]
MQHKPAKMRTKIVAVPSSDPSEMLYRGALRVSWEGGTFFPRKTPFNEVIVPIHIEGLVSEERPYQIRRIEGFREISPRDSEVIDHVIARVKRAYFKEATLREPRNRPNEMAQVFHHAAQIDRVLQLLGNDCTQFLYVNRQILVSHTIVNPIYVAIEAAKGERGTPALSKAGKNETGHYLTPSKG